MKDLISLNNNELSVNLNDISRFSGNKLKSTRDLILRHSEEFKELGLSITKEYDLKSQSELKLNEEQTMFLLILMKNSPIIKKFKLSVVKQFSKLRKDNNQLKLDFSENQSKEFETKIGSVKNQLAISQNETIEATKNRIGYTRDGNYQTLSKIKQSYQIDLSVEDMYKILVKKGIVSKKLVTRYDYIPTDSIAKDDNGQIVFYEDMIIEMFDKLNIKRVNGVYDSEPSLFKDML